MKNRGYQEKAVEGVFSEWEKVSATLGVAATGSGKTNIFCDVIRRRMPGRALILAHRKELVSQAVIRLRSFGIDAEIEQADLVATTNLFNASPVVVATPQTLYSNKFARLKRFKPVDFDTLICDEAHHYCGAPAFEAVVKHFKQNPNLKVLGVTATPDRTDNIAMAKIFDSVAFDIEITDLIQLGYLVDVDQRMVKIESLDFSTCRKTLGDLNSADLARVMEYEKTLQGMADATLATVGDKRTVVFAASVRQAERFAEIFNRHKSGCADCVFGHTLPEKRTEVLKRFGDGSLQICVNVAVLTEGYDCLDCSTEILTTKGWRGIGNVRTGEMMYALNRETMAMETVPIERYVERPIAPEEKFLTIRSQHVDVRTSEGHQFHVRSGGRLITVTGKELCERKSNYSLPLAAELDSLPGLPLSDDELRFVAWFMTDGGFQKLSVVISQVKPTYRKEIRELLVRLGLSFKSRVRQQMGPFSPANALPIEEFHVPKGTHSGTMKRSGWFRLAPYLDKNVSPLLHAMSRDQFRLFWDELLKGDGSLQSGKSGWLWTGRKSNADAYTHMAVIRGFSASCAESPSSSTGRTAYRISIRDKQWITSDPKDKRAARVELRAGEPEEIVWCVTNRLSTLIARRNGKIAIIGNCPGIEAVVMARGTLSRSLYAQMAGRGTRPLPGIVESVLVDDPELRRNAISESLKPSLLILDFVGNSGRHKLVTSADILGGKISEEARENALKRIKKKGAGKMLDELLLAEKELREQEEARKRDGLVARAKFNLTYINPFDVFKKRAEKWKGFVQTHPLTDKQRSILLRNGHNPDAYKLSEAQAILTSLFRASDKQINVLVKHGYPREEVCNLQKWEAGELITALANNGWKKPQPPREVPA